MLRQLWELILKDLKVFAADRKAMIISFLVPVAIASFMGMLTGNMNSKTSGETDKSSRIPVAFVDEDRSEVSKHALDQLKKSDRVEVQETDRKTADQWVSQGKTSYMVVLPAGFGETAVKDEAAAKAKLLTRTDPSKSTEASIAKGSVLPAIMSGIAKAKYGDVMGTSQSNMPFEEEDVSPKVAKTEWNGVGHSFAGMAVQGLLFWAIDAAMGILRERRQGIWRRLRAAPVSPGMLMLGKILSGAIRAFAILVVVFGAGALIFQMRVQGSWPGFLLVAVMASFMAATFGLFVAALGKTEQQSRGLSILAVLVMVMLGGAWFPSFLMPGWIQTLSKAMPVRWAVDGFDAMTWRAQGLGEAFPAVMALAGFSLFFGIFALKRIRWEYEA